MRRRRLQFQEVDPVVVEPAGLSATARVLSVLSDSAVAARDVSAHLAVLLDSRRLEKE